MAAGQEREGVNRPSTGVREGLVEELRDRWESGTNHQVIVFKQL